MTNTEIVATAVLGGFTVLGAAIRWSASVVKGIADRIVKAIDDSTAAWKETSTTVAGLTRQLVSMEAKLDVQKAVEAAVTEAVDEVSGVHDAQPAISRTPSRGVQQQHGYYPPGRPKTQGGR